METGFSYQWQYSRNGGASWSNSTTTGYNTATLTVDATLARNGYMYRCVLTGSKNSKIESKAAVLHVGNPVVISAQPQDVTAVAGAIATFTVEASNVYTYQWQYKSASMTNWRNTTMAGATTAELSVEVTANRNGYQYRCMIVGTDGNVVYTDAATLTVG